MGTDIDSPKKPARASTEIAVPNQKRFGWIRKNWQLVASAVTFLPVLLQWIFKAIKWLIGRGGDADFLISLWKDLGWVGVVIEFFLHPPEWAPVPLMIVGFALLFWWNARRHRLSTPKAPEQFAAEA